MNKAEMKEIISNSDRVLIGIGEEFSLGKNELEKMEIFHKYESEKNIATEWLLPYMIKAAEDEESITSGIKRAYKCISDLVKNKDYFVITTNMDDLIFDAGFDEQRLVMPCGNYKIYKCACNCKNTLWEAEDTTDIINKIKSVPLEKIKRPKCRYCNGDAEFNTIKSDNYIEEGYRKQWETYTEWIQGTLNKNLCILEFGVSIDYPTVIRWPFEKIAFYNQKSVFIRINEKMFYMPEELHEKGVSVPENSIRFLGN